MSQSADHGNTVGVDPTDGFNRRDTLKWAALGIRTVVYAAPHDSFGTSTFPVPCREVFKFADGKQPVTVIGPVLAEVSTPIVKGYFESRYAKVVEGCRISNKI